MSGSKEQITAWLVAETSSALLIQNTEVKQPDTVSSWIPRSQIPYLKRIGQASKEQHVKLHLNIKAWMMRYKSKHLHKFPEGHV